MRNRVVLVLSVLPLLALGSLSVTAGAVESPPGPNPPPSDIYEPGPDLNDGKPVPLSQDSMSTALRAAEADAEQPPSAPYEVGDTKVWIALDDVRGVVYLKEYVLRGVGDHIEVWVASGSDATSSGIEFQPGDCRNGVRTEISDEQVASLIEQFDGTIFPIESEAFSVPPDRSGAAASLPAMVGLPADYYQGPGDRIVTLVDNVRDDNFYDLGNTRELSYIAGFFSSQFNDLVDRNVMTIDGWDWLHRTGANPPHEPVPGDPCTSAPARPFLYEGVFAHEYQHLLEHYEDPDELSWVNEGLADWAQTITGYATPSTPITERGFDSHVQCFLGYLGVQTEANPNPRGGGPENSLTLWGDQGDGEVLCDYGAAYTLMELLAGRYGTEFMRALHRDDRNGLEGLDGLLRAEHPRLSASRVLHDWAAAVALDGVLDDGARLRGDRQPRALRIPTLDATINWDTADAYSEAGAPPNGSDYVRLRDASGAPLDADELRTLSFDGAGFLPSRPVEWVVDRAPPGGADGGPALHAGTGHNLDRAIARPVTVPTDDPTLRFDTYFSLEESWDFAFVQVSTDGGRTWTSLGNDLTTTEHDPAAIATVQDNVPGFTGNSGGGEEPVWVTAEFDLSAHAGQEVVVAFRYVTDPATPSVGWWVDDVTVGSTALSDGATLQGWRSPTELAPTPVHGFTVQVVGYTDDRRVAWVRTLPLDENGNVTLQGRPLRHLVGHRGGTVGVIVTYDDPTESVTQYAPYVLKANGVIQPGGGAGNFLGRQEPA